MKEIRIHARAGQGAITTATLLGFSYFNEGKFPYAFPNFGAARMGAPMNAGRGSVCFTPRAWLISPCILPGLSMTPPSGAGDLQLLGSDGWLLNRNKQRRRVHLLARVIGRVHPCRLWADLHQSAAD